MKFNHLFLSLVIGFFALPSCKDDEEKELVQMLPPSIFLLEDSSFVFTDTTVLVGDTLIFQINAFENEASQANLRRLQIARIEGNAPTVVLDSLIGGSAFGPFAFSATAKNQSGGEIFQFKIIDSEESESQVLINITTVLPNEPDDNPNPPRPNGSRAFGGFPVPDPLPVGDGEWLAGDLHVHTDYSSDASNRPMNEVLATAKANGLDFLGVTDHDNHVNGDLANNTWADPLYQSSEDLVLLYGAEWTTGKGHANTFAANPYDHQALFGARDAIISELQDVVFDLDLHFSANHPASGDPWGYGYDVVRSIEVWATSIWLLNTDAQTIWDDQLRTGRRMTGRGGSDSHHGYPSGFGDFNPNSLQALANAMGTPTTWVRSRKRNGDAVVEGLNAGRVSISATPNAPRLEFLASSQNNGTLDAAMGDNLVVNDDREIEFVINLENIELQPFFYRINVIKDGGTLMSQNILPGQRSVRFTHSPGAGVQTYYRVTMEGLTIGQANSPGSFLPSLPMVALTNPIYINYKD